MRMNFFIWLSMYLGWPSKFEYVLSNWYTSYILFNLLYLPFTCSRFMLSYVSYVFYFYIELLSLGLPSMSKYNKAICCQKGQANRNRFSLGLQRSWNRTACQDRGCKQPYFFTIWLCGTQAKETDKVGCPDGDARNYGRKRLGSRISGYAAAGG